MGLGRRLNFSESVPLKLHHILSKGFFQANYSFLSEVDGRFLIDSEVLRGKYDVQYDN